MLFINLMIVNLEILGPELTFRNTSAVLQEAEVGAAVEAEAPGGEGVNTLLMLLSQEFRYSIQIHLQALRKANYSPCSKSSGRSSSRSSSASPLKASRPKSKSKSRLNLAVLDFVISTISFRSSSQVNQNQDQ